MCSHKQGDPNRIALLYILQVGNHDKSGRKSLHTRMLFSRREHLHTPAPFQPRWVGAHPDISSAGETLASPVEGSVGGQSMVRPGDRTSLTAGVFSAGEDACAPGQRLRSSTFYRLRTRAGVSDFSLGVGDGGGR